MSIDILLIILLLCQGIFLATTVFFTWVTVKRANGLKETEQDMLNLKKRMTIFETDFSEKFDQFARRLGSRERMRAKREETEDSNTEQVLIPV